MLSMKKAEPFLHLETRMQQSPPLNGRGRLIPPAIRHSSGREGHILRWAIMMRQSLHSSMLWKTTMELLMYITTRVRLMLHWISTGRQYNRTIDLLRSIIAPRCFPIKVFHSLNLVCPGMLWKHSIKRWNRIVIWLKHGWEKVMYLYDLGKHPRSSGCI